MGDVLRGKAMEEATAKAMKAVREMILRNMDNQDTFKGIPIETCLEVVD